MRFLGRSFLAVVALFGFVGPASAKQTVKIGAALSMTGPAAAYGANQKTGIQAAVDEINKSGMLKDVVLEAVVKVEVRPGDFRDEMREMIELRDRIDREIHAVTGVRMTVELVAPNTLERSAGKAKRVLDRRGG